MSRKLLAIRGMLVALLAAAPLFCCNRADASIIYNYSQRWLHDSSSGLYWQILPVATSTFLPESGSIATQNQLDELMVHAGLPSGLFHYEYSTGSELASLADLLSFFQFNAPSASMPDRLQFEVGGVYSYTANPPTGPFEFLYMDYGTPAAGPPEWIFHAITTVGTYGPSHPCSGYSYSTGDGCPATQLAFIVTTAAPVPIPSSICLLITGFVGLGAIFRRRIAGNVANDSRSANDLREIGSGGRI